MNMTFSESVRVAIKAANNFLDGKYGEIPTWAVDLAFFSRLEASKKIFSDDMETVKRRFIFFVSRVAALRLTLEAVAFNADEFGDFGLIELEYEERGAWKKVELPTE